MPVATPPAPASAAAPSGAVAASGACKLCLVGMPGVGKTSLAHRLLHGRFPALPVDVAWHDVSARDDRGVAAAFAELAARARKRRETAGSGSTGSE